MNLLDTVAAVYAAVTAVRGSRRGVADEGYRLARLAVSLAAGCGLFTLIDGAVKALTTSMAGVGGPLGFAAGIGLTFFGLRKLKWTTMQYLQRTLAEKFNRSGGAIAGLLRALAAVTALIAFLQMNPWIPGVKGNAGNSLLYRVVSVFVPQAGKNNPQETQP